MPFIDDFLRLEAAGWKGSKGTAIQQQAKLVCALKDALVALHRTGKLRFWRITFNGNAIACLFAFTDQGRAALGKIAYDESFAKYSPGVMIIIDATASLYHAGDVALVDSTAIAGHPMIDRIWRDRLPMADIIVASSRVSAARFNLVVFALEKQTALRTYAKMWYYRMKGEKTS
jgi:Acetyltransferase (GNAT) domain